MDPVDRAWLEMDEPGNPMVISAVLQLEGPVDAAGLQRQLVQRLLRYPRFHQVVEGDGAAACWTCCDDLDFSYHVRVQRLPTKDHERHLRKAVSEEVSRDLDRARPLWRLLLFPRPGHPVTVLFRVHHALADGIALVSLLVDSTDAGLLRVAAPHSTHNGRHAHTGPLGKVIDRLEGFNDGLLRMDAVRDELRHPRQLLRRLRQGRAALGAVRRLLSLPDNRPEALRQGLSGHRRVTWADDLSFAPLRRSARRQGVRVNDLFMAALTGALRSELSRTGGAPAQDLRVSIPVNLRRGRGRELGNQFGLVLLDLPVGAADAAERLGTVARRMQQLKRSLEAKVTLLGLAAAGHLPVPLERRVVGMIGTRSAAVVSNLPGPPRPVHIAGARLRNLVFWPPQAGGMGIGISFFTYAGKLSIGISADRRLLPNPESLLASLRKELADASAADSRPLSVPGRPSRQTAARRGRRPAAVRRRPPAPGSPAS